MGEGVCRRFCGKNSGELNNENAVFRLADMGTIIEGDVQELLHLPGKIHDSPFEQGEVRVVSSIRTPYLRV